MDLGYTMDLIREYGVFGWLARYPINPITIVVGVVILGIVALIINSSVRKRRAAKVLAANPAAALLVLRKTESLMHDDYADNLRLSSLNGAPAAWFFVKPTIPALYLNPGANQLTLHADWARERGTKLYHTEPVTLTLTADAGGCYLLEYYLPESRYLFTPYTPPSSWRA